MNKEIIDYQAQESTYIAGMFDPALLPGSLSRELLRLSDEVNLLGYELMSKADLAKMLRQKAVNNAEAMSKTALLYLTEREIRSRLKIWNTRLELLQDRYNFFSNFSDGLECCYGEWDELARKSRLYRDPRVWNPKDFSPEALEHLKENFSLSEKIRVEHDLRFEVTPPSHDPLELIFMRLQRCTHQFFLIWKTCIDLLAYLEGPEIPTPSAIDWDYYWPNEAAGYRTLTEEERDDLYFGMNEEKSDD